MGCAPSKKQEAIKQLNDKNDRKAKSNKDMSYDRF